MVSSTLKKVLCAMGPRESAKTFVEVTLQLRPKHSSIVVGCGVTSLEVIKHAKDQEAPPREKTVIPEGEHGALTPLIPQCRPGIPDAGHIPRVLVLLFYLGSWN